MRRAAGTITRAAISGGLVVALLAGCGGRAAPAAHKNNCRDVARAGERWIAAATEAERADALAFAVEQIDLCQAPGLGRALTQCLAAATTVAAATSCPGVTAVHRGALAPPLPHGSHGVESSDDEYDADDEPEPLDPF